MMVSRGESVWHDYRAVFAALAAALVVVLARAAAEAKFLRTSLTDVESALRGTGELLADRPLRYIVRRRRTLALAAAMGLPLLILLMLAGTPDTTILRGTIATLCLARVACALAAEIFERYLFFAASVSPRMPGGLV
jgi:hypothetical protein